MATAFSSHRELLRHVLAAMGLGSAILPLPACGETAAATPSADAASDPTSTAADATPFDSSIGQPPIIIPPRVDGDFDVADRCHQLVFGRTGSETAICPVDAGDGGSGDPRLVRVRACLPAPPMGQSCTETYSEWCILNTYSCGLSGRAQVVLCGPLPGPPDAPDACCYVTGGGCPVGRPFLVGGVARLAPIGSDPTWSASLEPDVAALDAATRAALADAWTQDGLAEHASVASFSRFVLQCLSVGAPADIVEGAQRACADELEHARVAFGLASAYAGRPIGPGRLEVRDALDGSLDSIDVACGVAAEGCIAELVSASLIAVAAESARDAAVKNALARIAEQELDHALLAWRYLTWAWRAGDARLRTRVATVFDRMDEYVGFGARTSLKADPDRMRDHGYLGVGERQRIAVSVVENVIRPAARALFAANSETPRRDVA